MTVDPFALTPAQIANARTPEQLAAAANGATTGQGSQDPTATAPSITSTVAAPGANPLPGQTAAPQNQSQPAATTTSAPVTPVSGYTGPSIVDYLNSLGLPADRASLTARATSMGIQNYTGTAAQNTKMLSTLRAAATPPAAPAPSQTSTATTTDSTATAGNSGGADSGTAPDKYAGMDPIARQVAEYTDAATALGISTIKDQIDGYNKQLNDLNNEQQDKIDNVNNNPWLSEGIRTTSIKKIQDSYATRTDTLTHLITLTSSLYTQAQAQVEKIVGGAETDRAAIAKAAADQVTAAAALAKDNSVQSVGGRELLINKATGKTVADLGPTTKTSSTSDTTKAMTSDVQDAVSQLQTIVRTKNFAGVDPGDYQKMADYLQATYGTKAVAALKTALNALGLQVDVVGDGKLAN